MGLDDGFKHNYAYLQEHLTPINLYKHPIMTELQVVIIVGIISWMGDMNVKQRIS